MLAVEKLLDLEVPLRAPILRVLFAEMTRICNHMLNIPAHAHGRRRDDADPVGCSSSANC